MNVRSYDHAGDYERINRFLIEIYQPGEVLRAWLQPRWEYMHFHTLIEGLPLDRIGIAEDGDGRILGVVHFEHHPAFNYLQIRPRHEHLYGELLDYAETHLGGESKTFGRRVLGFYVNDFDQRLESIVQRRGYQKQDDFAEEQSRYLIDGPVPSPPLPDGFRLKSLADDNDFHKINRVLWRGFDHEGPPPDEEVAGRQQAQRAPNFRRDLTIVAVTPNGDYGSFAGMWAVSENKVCYVEPVATDPSYRRMGLGRAAVLESIRRAASEGAEVAWVGSGQEFYLAMGFTIQNTANLWVKPLD
jgi:predicted N-acetyltransferase YhbS